MGSNPFVDTIFIKKNLQIRYMVLMVVCVLCGLAIMGLELTATLNDLFDAYPVLVQPIYDEFIPIVSDFFYKKNRNNTFYFRKISKKLTSQAP